VTLRAEVVDLVGIDLAHQRGEIVRVVQVAEVEAKPRAVLVRIHVEVLDPRRVEARGAAIDAVDFIALAEQKLRKVAAVLAGEAGDQRLLHVDRLPIGRAWSGSRGRRDPVNARSLTTPFDGTAPPRGVGVAVWIGFTASWPISISHRDACS